ncbi:alpha/beta hydrolase [Actinokineospora auranticolor]|uniref:Alpha/beta hydrolase family protein n=1 Tax=Actinokineospora auranticolor TaxID=155976 RepID=A0A2S6GKK3_9PSEU|nr:alpha/beta hydrolase [Actinokineospora auranticolor]PPK65681.1 alpha/beta hydrolase family protein [Actinokineospora auranticolor]
MRRIARAVGGFTAAVAIAAGMVPVASAESLGQRRIEWGPCPESAHTECGKLSVPVDWAEPGGTRIDLTVARRKAGDPARRIGVLLVNPGGPGGSGVDVVLAAEQVITPDLLARFDIVSYDARGIGRSQPVRCSAELLGRQPTAYPASQTEFDALVAYNRELAADCRARSGPVFDHADSLSVVRDIDAYRRALGERKISFYGLSYGTLIGQQYAEEYGEHVRAMILDSNMDHSLDARGLGDTGAAAGEDSFAEFVAWCDRTPGCALHGRDVGAVWDGLLARADHGEVVDGSGRVVTANGLARGAHSQLAFPNWSELAEQIAAADGGAPIQFPNDQAQPVDGTLPNSYLAIFCQDWAVRARDQREVDEIRTRLTRIAPHLRGSPNTLKAVLNCTGLPEKVNNPQHRLRVTKAPEILMMAVRHDPATAYAWSANAHRQIRGTSVLLTYEGWGHGVYHRSDCARQAMDRYLLELRAPRDGARCPAVEPAPPAPGLVGAR